MSETSSARPSWPADIIHVNEDGWVLINRGRLHGVAQGLQLLVVGQGIRDLHDLFAANEGDREGGGEEPLVLRIRRTYDQLVVVHVEESCAVAIATRTPVARRPTFYRGPEGELLVWVPLPEGYTWPKPGADDDEAEESQLMDSSTDEAGEGAETGGEAGKQEEAAESEATVVDHPPERAEQDDERWEEALPLNGVNVGDIVVPAIPVTPATGDLPAANAPSSGQASGNPFEAGRAYDWMNQNQQQP